MDKVTAFDFATLLDVYVRAIIQDVWNHDHEPNAQAFMKAKDELVRFLEGSSSSDNVVTLPVVHAEQYGEEVALSDETRK